MSNAIDHRIFGFNDLGQLRANLYNGAGMPDAGALYSWVWASTLRQLAHKLDEQWEQPLSESEFEVLEQLEAETEAEPMACEDCGGTGVDPGGLDAHAPEDCPACNGTGQESHVPMLARRPVGRQNFNAPARTEVA
jgi:DnaJ-class molecular chaperone